MAELWSDAPMIFIQRERCPACGSLATPIRVRTMPTESDDSFVRRNICANCSRRFLTVLEVPLPERGNADCDVG